MKKTSDPFGLGLHATGGHSDSGGFLGGRLNNNIVVDHISVTGAVRLPFGLLLLRAAVVADNAKACKEARHVVVRWESAAVVAAAAHLLRLATGGGLEYATKHGIFTAAAGTAITAAAFLE